MSSPAIQPMETANANPSAQAPNPSAGPSASPSNPPNPSNPPTTYNITYTALDNDFMTFLQQLSDHHRQEVLAIRSARRHKLFALICFLFFIVVRLWILAILEKDWFLMSFCLLCTVFTFHAWKKERTRGDAELSNALGDIMRSLEENSLEPENAGVDSDEKAKWKRFKYNPDSDTSLEDMEAGGGAKSLPPPPDSPSHSHPQAIMTEEQNLCSICICEYEHDDDCVQLPCSHIYHHDCLEQWINNHHKCPLCNLDLRSEEVRARAEAREQRREAERRRQEQQHQRMQNSGILVFSA
ncbi:hypothetical protein TrST_g3878 [Triparma strigata]|uniref:RING-type domain-containing protein n=1 Tax=Triparma strigata TaxID=1606541 RepID=A0A9W7EUY4_9STRA|nr:hypothetical protein TrST_g3878 [Triparma strigata]